MKPQDKAKELIEKFFWGPCRDKKQSKQCALIAVEEIINTTDMFGYGGTIYNDFETRKPTFVDRKHPSDYWRQVKEEIEKL